MAISSQALDDQELVPREGSTTIPRGSRAKRLEALYPWERG